MPALVLSLPECFQFHAWLPAYLNTAASMFFSVRGMHMFVCLLEPGTISRRKKEQLLLNYRQVLLSENCSSCRQQLRFTEVNARMCNVFFPAPARPTLLGKEGVQFLT